MPGAERTADPAEILVVREPLVVENDRINGAVLFEKQQ
jgi:hypothetical protein